MVKLRNYELKTLFENDICKDYSIKLDRIKEGEKVSLFSDVMFKTMFQNENRLKYSCKFLSYFLDVSYEELLTNLKLAKNEIDKKKENDKGERCDYVALVNGSYINIEVNNNSSLWTMERNIEYLMRLYSRKVKRNTEYEYTQSISINLNNFSIKGNNKIIDIYTLKNDEGILLTDKLIIIQIYVPNLRKKWYNEGIKSLNELERYILTLVERRIDEAKKLGIGDEIMEEYVDESIEVSDDMNFGESYDKEWALKDEGRREGIYEERLEIAKNMLVKGMNVLLISELTGLSTDEIIKLKEDM